MPAQAVQLFPIKDSDNAWRTENTQKINRFGKKTDKGGETTMTRPTFHGEIVLEKTAPKTSQDKTASG